jgi:Ser/Thr protein kinase RdoA (MazF antagonist)
MYKTQTCLISPQLQAVLKNQYPIGVIQKVFSLSGGKWNQVFCLNCEQGNFVVKISHHTTTLEDIVYEHKLMKFMNHRIPEVLAPITTEKGTTYLCYNGLLIMLFPLMPGQMLNRDREEECIAAARMLAHLHRAGLEYPALSPRFHYPSLKDLNWECNRAWRWREIEKLLFNQTKPVLKTTSHSVTESYVEQIFARRSEIVKEREYFRNWIANLYESGRTLTLAPIHGDYWRNNVLVQNDVISAVLDWNKCQVEWLVYEVGQATWEFCKNRSQNTLDFPKAVRFLQAYQEAGGAVPSSDFDLIVPFIRCLRIIEILFALQHSLDSSQQPSPYGLNEHLMHNLLSLENLRGVELSF